MEDEILFPGATIGIIGESPNGIMLEQAAHKLGFDVIAYGPNEEAPTLRGADVKVVGTYTDQAKLQDFAQRCSLVTYESETIPAQTIAYLSRFTKLPQGSETLEIVQDRLLERTFFEQSNLNIAPYATIVNLDDVYQAISSIGYPAILKPIQKGFSKKIVIKKQTDIAKCADIIDQGTFILESMIPYQKELAVTMSKDKNGDIKFYPLVEAEYRQGKLHQVLAPAQVDSDVANEIRRLSELVVKQVKSVGIMTLSFFLTETGALYVKRLVTGVNSLGYVFSRAANVDIFEQHLRVLANMPLAQPELIQATGMVMIEQDKREALRTQWLLKTNWHYQFYRYPKSMTTLNWGHVLVTGESSQAIKEQVAATGIWDKLEE
ncbi:ATP-grasp domain-containing protein [Lactobacillus agilis]|uniref:ATP-grasp domain-containing protein n=1 Tax=Ligilactobacillus agilis TaxID=1601 RepID=A0A6F9Y7J7_9LACO|nr:ATP-grasp domain-containing protein [Ligilactobacillus agilis]MBM6772683.1 ATP-grasp domain-containing protein [Ligilactobacillus agilis]MCI5761396.1 ATP-grasp domain-containing protein [Ligilactobacillus agilis]MCL8204205.1 ATP-grasp domain-containing protein [Ligilactobacillus agilis]MDO4455819.1 ATP-grasp domain-containing protein [Ligilactobacillus agilis]MDY4064437.1 ATP-grasp domain-containing protein [Ligilactobacillus agilis]